MFTGFLWYGLVPVIGVAVVFEKGRNLVGVVIEDVEAGTPQFREGSYVVVDFCRVVVGLEEAPYAVVWVAEAEAVVGRHHVGNLRFKCAQAGGVGLQGLPEAVECVEVVLGEGSVVGGVGVAVAEQDNVFGACAVCQCEVSRQFGFGFKVGRLVVFPVYDYSPVPAKSRCGAAVLGDDAWAAFVAYKLRKDGGIVGCVIEPFKSIIRCDYSGGILQVEIGENAQDIHVCLCGVLVGCGVVNDFCVDKLSFAVVQLVSARFVVAVDSQEPLAISSRRVHHPIGYTVIVLVQPREQDYEV